MEEKTEKEGFKALLRDTIIPKIEFIGALLLLISLVLKLWNGNVNLQMVGIALTTFAMTYYFNAFLFIRKSSGFLESFSVRVGFMSSSVAIVGLMFSALSLPGADAMLPLGLLALGLAIIVTLYNLVATRSELYKKLLIRFAIVFIIGIAIYLQP